MKVREVKPIEVDPNKAYLDKNGQVHFLAAPREEVSPDQPHFHPCAVCQEPMICWCPVPEVDLKDQLSLCDRCEDSC